MIHEQIRQMNKKNNTDAEYLRVIFKKPIFFTHGQ